MCDSHTSRLYQAPGLAFLGATCFDFKSIAFSCSELPESHS